MSHRIELFPHNKTAYTVKNFGMILDDLRKSYVDVDLSHYNQLYHSIIIITGHFRGDLE